MLRQMQEKANFGVAGNTIEGTYPGASARGRYPEPQTIVFDTNGVTRYYIQR